MSPIELSWTANKYMQAVRDAQILYEAMIREAFTARW